MKHLIDPETGERYGLEVVACSNSETLGYDDDGTAVWLADVDANLIELYGSPADARDGLFQNWNGGKYSQGTGGMHLYPRYFKMVEDCAWEDLDGDPMTYTAERVHQIPCTIAAQVMGALLDIAIGADQAAEAVQRAEDEMRDLDEITRSHTGFDTFEDMLNAAGGYRPSIYTDGASGGEKKLLADAYDRFQEARGDARRAYRG